MNQNPLEQLHKLAKTMENKLDKVANKLSQLPKTPQAGYIVRIENKNTIGLLQWVLLYSQSEEWFIVPADDNPMLFDKSSGIDTEEITTGNEKYISIEWSFNINEQFCIAIQLDDVSFT